MRSPTKWGMEMKTKILTLILVILILSSCGPNEVVVVAPPTPSGPTVKETYDEYVAIENVFTDNLEIAFATSRGSLPPVIQSLKESVRAIEAVNPSDKIPSQIWRACVERFSLPTDAFISFLGQESDSTVSSLFDRGIASQGRCSDWFAENLPAE